MNRQTFLKTTIGAAVASTLPIPSKANPFADLIVPARGDVARAAAVIINCSEDAFSEIVKQAEDFALKHGLEARVRHRKKSLEIINGEHVEVAVEPHALVRFTQFPENCTERPTIIIYERVPSQGFFDISYP
jgi:hypothetical protein